VAVPPGAERIDLSGRILVAGLVNAHGHVGATMGMRSAPELYTEENLMRQLRLYAAYGVTTVFSLGDDREIGVRLRDRQRAGATDMARLYVAGPVIGGTDPVAARKLVGDVAAMGADLVKIRVDDNLGTTQKMAREAYEAVIDEAHRRKLRVAAHVYYLEDAKALVRAGVDMLAHSVRDREVDTDLITLMKQRDTCLCPTLMREVSTFVYEARPAFFDDPFFLRHADHAAMKALEEPSRQEAMRASRSAQSYKASLVVAAKNLATLAAAGVRIASGTDTGPVARFQGYFEHLELERMVEAGLSPSAVIRAATGDAARCHGVAGEVGTIEPGARADFIVLTANPLADIRNSRTIESVWIGGSRLPG
jgi:imidazolonepropionase-like amidohydrolase